jgi:thiamine pyrophosphokinase
MKIGICASGPMSLMHMPPVDYLIGVDRGAMTLLENGYVPDEIVGDFDSVSEAEYQHIISVVTKYERVSPLKDETDTDLALLKAIALSPSEVYVTCVTGGRLDHQEAVLRAVQQFQMQYPGIRFAITDTHNEMRFLLPGTHKLQRDAFKYVSFFSVTGTIQDVTLIGVKYETSNLPMSQLSTMFTSNEIVSDNASISFSNGICLMIKSND